MYRGYTRQMGHGEYGVEHNINGSDIHQLNESVIYKLEPKRIHQGYFCYI